MLFDHLGNRKYLTGAEWQAFLAAAEKAEPFTRTFCATIAYCGARISEVRALTANSIDEANEAIVFECLKRQRKGVFRAVSVPRELIKLINDVHGLNALKSSPDTRNNRLWPWCRTTAWQRVKDVCAEAGIPDFVSKPKALRHSFGVRGTAQAGVPISTMKRWLGHSRIESTLIYCDALGREERALAERMWSLSREVNRMKQLRSG